MIREFVADDSFYSILPSCFRCKPSCISERIVIKAFYAFFGSLRIIFERSQIECKGAAPRCNKFGCMPEEMKAHAAPQESRKIKLKYKREHHHKEKATQARDIPSQWVHLNFKGDGHGCNERHDEERAQVQREKRDNFEIRENPLDDEIQLYDRQPEKQGCICHSLHPVSMDSGVELNVRSLIMKNFGQRHIGIIMAQ